MSPPVLELDYLAAPRRALWPGALVLAAGVALCAVSFERYRVALEALSTLEPTPDRSGYWQSRGRFADRAQQARAESVMRRLGLPWAPLLQAIEAASGGDVALLQMQPRADEHSVQLTAEARDPAAMLDYLRRLDASPLLSEVRLVRHRVRDDDPSHPVRFDVRASFGRGA